MQNEKFSSIYHFVHNERKCKRWCCTYHVIHPCSSFLNIPDPVETINMIKEVKKSGSFLKLRICVMKMHLPLKIRLYNMGQMRKCFDENMMRKCFDENIVYKQPCFCCIINLSKHYLYCVNQHKISTTNIKTIKKNI